MARHIFSGNLHSPTPGWGRFWPAAGVFTLGAFFLPAISAQVITIDTSGHGPVAGHGPVERQYQQIQPTHVVLPSAPMNSRDKLQIVRIMQAEQGFAMRPLPRGRKGLMLEANGKLDPAGEAYLNMVISNGLSVKPGQRVVITNVKVDKNKLIFDLNDGPDAKHRFLSHVSIGMGGPYDQPVVPDQGQPGGARLTLAFKDNIPELTGDQVKALLAPLISFDVKTPVQAYTDTLPKPLKEAILSHEVLVGMNLDMVTFAKGQPQTKYHEMDGQMPVDIWLYGQPPQDVTFVRINGNRVIRVEIAKAGKPVEVFTKDVVSPMLMGTSLANVEQAQNVHVIQEGDVHRNSDTQAPAPPPTLRKPGETLPNTPNSAGEMKPVEFPKQQPDDYPDAAKARQEAQEKQQQQPNAAPAPGAQSAPSNGSTQSPPGQASPAQTGTQSGNQAGSGANSSN